MPQPVTRRPRARVIATHFALNVLLQVLGISSQLLLVPAFMTTWGSALYGDWLALSAASAYVTMTDMGMQVYVINLLTGSYLKNRPNEFEQILHSSLTVYLVVALGVVTALAATPLLPWDSWFSGRAMTPREAAWTTVVLGLNAMVALWGGFVGELHRVYGAPQRVAAVGLVVRSLLLAVTVGLLHLSQPPLRVASAHLTIMIGTALFVMHDVRRRAHVPVFSLRAAQWGRAKSLIGPSLIFATYTMASGLSVHGTVLVASTSLGSDAVASYATSRTLANVIRQSTSVLGIVAWPEFTRLEATGRYDALTSSYGVLVKACSTLAAWLGVVLWYEGGFVYGVWTRGTAQLDQWLLTYLLLHVVFHTPATAGTTFLVATNRHRHVAALAFVQGLATLLLAILLPRYHGVGGLGLALLLGEVPLAALLVPRWIEETRVIRGGSHVVTFYVGLVLLCGVLLIVGGVSSALFPPGYVQLGIVLAATLGAALTCGALWLREHERSLITSAFRRKAAGPIA